MADDASVALVDDGSSDERPMIHAEVCNQQTAVLWKCRKLKTLFFARRPDD